MSYDVVISNSKINSYGFRVLTEGIDIVQYVRNPILLWMHNRPFRDTKEGVLPIGHLENLRVDGDDLKGTLVFDETDEFSRSIRAKWDAGTLRMVSAGLDVIARSDSTDVLLPGQRYPTITESRLREVSVVDIGANDDALALYDAGERVELSFAENGFLQPINNHLNNKNMKDVALRLGLSADATKTEVLTELDKVVLSAEQAEGLRVKVEKQEHDALVALVDSAVEDRRVLADSREHFVEMGKVAGFDVLKKTLSLMQPAVRPSDFLSGNGGKGGAGGAGDYKKLSEVPTDEAIRLRAENWDLYAKLYKAEYGVAIEQ